MNSGRDAASGATEMANALPLWLTIPLSYHVPPNKSKVMFLLWNVAGEKCNSALSIGSKQDTRRQRDMRTDSSI